MPIQVESEKKLSAVTEEPDQPYDSPVTPKAVSDINFAYPGDIVMIYVNGP